MQIYPYYNRRAISLEDKTHPLWTFLVALRNMTSLRSIVVEAGFFTNEKIQEKLL